jgi:hypothetical protein
MFPELTPADIKAIDLAGAKGARRQTFVKTVRVFAELMLLGAVLFRIYAFLAENSPQPARYLSTYV